MRFSTRIRLNERSARVRAAVTRYNPTAEEQRQLHLARIAVAAAQKRRKGRPQRAPRSHASKLTSTARSLGRSNTLGRSHIVASPSPSPSLASASADTSTLTYSGSDQFSVPTGTVNPEFGSGTLVNPFDVDLYYVCSKTNSDKFYQMQIVERDDGFYYVGTKWGRRGTTGQNAISRPLTRPAAVATFRTKFRAKTGLDFGDRNAVQLDGKYRMAKRLHESGAKGGEIAFSLMWDNSGADRTDMDLHVICPSGEEINYHHKQSQCNGTLDVDRRQLCTEPIENIVWAQAPRGRYKVGVNRYCANHVNLVPFKVGITIAGTREIREGVSVHKEGSGTKNMQWIKELQY